MIGLHIGIAFVISIPFMLFLSLIPINWVWSLGLVVGLIIWTVVLYKTPVFDWTFINVQKNWSVIVANQIVYDKLPDDKNARTKAFPLTSVREVGSGIRGKKPNEVVIESINLLGELVTGTVEGGEKLQCYTRDNIPLLIGWQAVLTPLQGYLVNLARKGEDASKAFFRGEFEQFIISWIKTRDEDNVFSSLENLKKEFTDSIFGGSDVVDPREEEYGIFTNTPQIISVVRDPRFQKAAEGVEIMKKVTLGIGLLNKEFSTGQKPDANVVLATASAAAGIEIPGLLIIPGLGGDGAKEALAHAAKHGVPPSGSKKGK